MHPKKQPIVSTSGVESIIASVVGGGQVASDPSERAWTMVFFCSPRRLTSTRLSKCVPYDPRDDHVDLVSLAAVLGRKDLAAINAAEHHGDGRKRQRNVL